MAGDEKIKICPTCKQISKDSMQTYKKVIVKNILKDAEEALEKYNIRIRKELRNAKEMK